MGNLLYLNGLNLFVGASEVPFPDFDDSPLPASPEIPFKNGDAFPLISRLEQVFVSCAWNVSASPEGLQFIHRVIRTDPDLARALIGKLRELSRDDLIHYLLQDTQNDDHNRFLVSCFTRLYGRLPHPEIRQFYTDSLNQDEKTQREVLEEQWDFHHQHFVRENQPFANLPRTLVFLAAELFIALNELDSAESALSALRPDLNDLRRDDAIFRIRWYRDRGLPPVEEIGREMREHFCDQPWVQFQVLEGGNVAHCCYEWLPHHIGSLFLEKEPDAVINGRTTRNIRAAIQDGSYRYCSKLKCRFLRDVLLPKRDEVRQRPLFAQIIENRSSDAAERFGNLYLAYDSSCNLSCPSCRDHLIIANKGEREIFWNATERHILPMLKRTDRVTTSGYGDPFVSPVFRRMLREISPETHPDLKINLMTNGLLLTPKNWEENVAHLGPLMGTVSISIDAAHAETYAVVRRGGDFRKIEDNLAFAQQLLAEGKIEWLQINFIVQKRNFREMDDFVRLGHRFGVSAINFQELFYWPHGHTHAEFLDWAVHLPDHPLHKEFLQRLADPILHDVLVVHDFRHLLPKRPWPLHNREGLRDAFGNPRQSLSFHDEYLGQLWTSESNYPYFYQSSSGRWLYYWEGSDDPRWFAYTDDPLNKFKA